MLEIWKNALTNPKPTFAKEKRNSSVSEGVKHLAIPFAILGLLLGAIVAFFAGFLAFIPGLQWLAGIGFAAIVIAPILMVVLGLIGSLVGVGVTQVASKLLGGKGSFPQLFYLMAIFQAPLTLVVWAVNIIPAIGAIISLLLGLYSVYLEVLALKEVHGFSTLRALGAMVLTLVVSAVFVFLAVILFGGALGAAAATP